ncbi:MAG: phosphate--acyl-ACP acyltransferase, partial [Acidobacteriota bacterium]|nr:phosphate--acyl-ACP acyltransferase [Acidobacteriota bacterium]
MRIAVDAMGGDHAPHVNVDAAIAASREFGIQTLLVGSSSPL